MNDVVITPLCDVCIHADICKNKEIVEHMLVNEELMGALKSANARYDWLDVVLHCKHYGLDLYSTKKVENIKEPEEKKSAVDYFKDMLFGGPSND